MIERSDFRDRILLVSFICGHCPYVQAIEGRLIELAREFLPKDVSFLAICSNDATDYPEDSPTELLRRWREKGYGFPYLIDTEQKVAREFGAVCTPDFFLYDSTHHLRYRGRLDDSWRHPDRVQRQELREAIELLISNKDIPRDQVPSMGCSIKWKE